MPYVRRALVFLGYTYLLRVPLITWAVLVALWAGSFPSSGAEPILRGIFDIASPESPILVTCVRFGAVTLAALLACTSIGVSARLVICNAHLRFRVAAVAVSPGLELLFRVIPFAAFAAVVGTSFERSQAQWYGKLAGIAAGAVLWYLLTIAARDFFASLDSKEIKKFRAGAFVPESEPGYFDAATGALQARHLFATYQLVLALAAYIVYCIVSGVYLAYFGGRFLAPALSQILALLSLICWGFAGAAFFLDRYRVPLLIPLLAMAFISGEFKQGDYFYQGLPLPSGTRNAVTAKGIIEAHAQGPDANSPIVLVATTGGGIQATAWTARVLTGLNEQVTVGSGATKKSFSHYVRLISAVSGGSVGAMYFAAGYDNGEVKNELDGSILANAEESSLDQVAWGLAYPDLVFGLFPWLKGIGVASGGLRLADAGSVFLDRGRLLEESWRRRLPQNQRDATLSKWGKDAASGLRPALILNSTLVETGERYLLSTTQFTDSNASKTKREEYLGRWEFFKLYPNSDLPVPTAARLSATFPYVTPAARMLRNDSEGTARRGEDGSFYRPEPHAVDGAYYDNYGMASLLDWLDNGLQAAPERPKILIVEIRASPTATETRPLSSSFGTLFQLTNPLETLANVRGAGQLSHAALDENLMNRIYTPNLCEAIFEFSNTDANGCPRNEPLNWHLTPTDIKALQTVWQNSGAIQENISRVRSFLSGGACLVQ